MSVEQYNTLVELMPQIEKSLKSKGETVARPSYDDEVATSDQSSAAVKPESEDEQQIEEDEEEGAAPPTTESVAHSSVKAQQPSKLDRFKYAKPNHEATSNEKD